MVEVISFFRWVLMTCPLFVDYTRECIEKFKDLIQIESFSICESDEGYKDCIFYIAIKNPEKNCQYSEQCIQVYFMYLDGQESFGEKWFSDVGKIFCLDPKNRINCARFKEYEAGKKPSPHLLPDGTIVATSK